MSGEVIIRPATPADREALGELWWEMMAFHQQYDSSFFQLKPKPEALAHWLQYLDGCLADERQFVLVAEVDGELAGFTNGRLGEDAPYFSSSPHGFITNFVVSERFRRRGLGRKMFAAVCAYLREHGVTAIRLTVSVANPASNAFWRELGFEPSILTMRKKLE